MLIRTRQKCLPVAFYLTDRIDSYLTNGSYTVLSCLTWIRFNFSKLAISGSESFSNHMRKDRGAATLSEYPVALFILLLLFVVPLIDLVGLVTGSCIACLIAHQSATRASDHQRYDTSLSTMQQEASNLLQTGFAA